MIKTVLGSAILVMAISMSPTVSASDYVVQQDQHKHDAKNDKKDDKKSMTHEGMKSDMPAKMEKMMKMHRRMSTLIMEMPDSPRKTELLALDQKMKMMRENMMHKMPAPQADTEKQEHKH